MTVELFGWNDLKQGLEAYATKADKGVMDAIKVTAFAIERDAIKSMSVRGKGKIYQRGNITHQASAEGDAPSTDTGRLAASVKAIIKTKEAYVGTDVDYGFFLEFGTRKVAERPWLRRAKEKNMPMFRNRVKAALK